MTCRNASQISAPETIRTSDTRFRRAVLYPLSYEGAQRPGERREHRPIVRHVARSAYEPEREDEHVEPLQPAGHR